MRLFLAACLIPVAIVVTALVVNGASPADVLPHHHFLLGYCALLAIQLCIALLATAAIAVVSSVAGSCVRWSGQWARLPYHGPVWRGLTAEGVVFGVALVGAYLGWAPTDVYENPDGPQSVEVRLSSLIEVPLGLGRGSDCFVEVTATWRDGSGRSVVQRGSELKCRAGAERVVSRSVSWGKGDTPRTVVELPETGSCLFFPESVRGAGSYAPDSVIDAYLRNEPVAAVERLWREGMVKARVESL